MQKTWIFTLVILLFMGCGAEKSVVNRQFKDKEGRNEMIGEQVRSAFNHPNYSEWFNSEYDAYSPNPEAIEKLTKLLKGVKVKIFFGSWCSDSRTYLPQFLKILDEARFNDAYYHMYAVNRKKESFYGEEQGCHLLYVPTFIFYNNKNVTGENIEINRIIESPVGNSLEEDMVKILSGETYVPNYYY